jgi:uncharacterized protein involved in outer membrane biogenesis
MIRKTGLVAGAVIGVILVLFVATWIVLVLAVDREFIQQQMADALNRRVSIESIDVSVFSVLSGIEVKNVRVSNYTPVEKRKELTGKPIEDGELFARLERLIFTIRFIPLLSGDLDLRELVLHGPEVYLVRSKSGALNIDDLLTSEKKEPSAEVEEEKEESAPLKADDIPVSLSLGKLGMEDGDVFFTDRGSGRTLHFYSVELLVRDLEVDPENLEKKNRLRLQGKTGIKTKGSAGHGGVESFDLFLSLDGSVVPFDLESRELNPAVHLEITSNRGRVTGLEIYNRIGSVQALERFTGKLEFLRGDLTWKDAGIIIDYKGGTARLKKGAIRTDNGKISLQGETNIYTREIDISLDLLVAEKHRDRLEKGLEKNISKVLAGDAKKFLKAEDIAKGGMDYLENEKGELLLGFRAVNTWNKPRVRLVRPKLPTLEDMVTEALKDAGKAVKDKAEERIREEVKEGKDKVEKEVKKKAGKKANKVKKSLGF